jgi:hypothetical protein
MILLLTIGAFVAAGCDSGEDAVGEKLAEEVIESQGGEDVDIDVDGEDVTIDTKDGSFSTSGELPKDWPDDVKLPDGAKIVAVTDVSADGKRQVSVTATSGDSVDDVAEQLGDQFEGWTSDSTGSFGTGSDKVATGSWKDGDRTASMTVTGGSEGETTMILGLELPS